MSAKVDSEIQSFQLELEKFSSRWDQLKPRDDIATSGDKEATTQALASLKERRAEFNELMSTADKLRFGWMDSWADGRYPQASAMELALASVIQSWVQYSTALLCYNNSDTIVATCSHTQCPRPHA